MMNRRQFVILTTAAAAGCTKLGGDWSRAEAGEDPNVFDAGHVSDYPADGVYDRFRREGLIIVRRDGRLYAISSVCTHRGCKVRALEDESFYCRCHHSRFDRDGKVTDGPAPRPLPRLAVATNEENHLLVNLDRPFTPAGES